jgi:hypothetical protein
MTTASPSATTTTSTRRSCPTPSTTLRGPSTTTFHHRRQVHDSEATAAVVDALTRLGAYTHRGGSEWGDGELRDRLREQYDPVSLMLRYRPDQIVVWPGERAMLVEIKSAPAHYPNFAVECDSIYGAMLWAATGGEVLYTFYDSGTRQVTGCWAEEIGAPRRIYIPCQSKQQDAIRVRERMHSLFPAAELVDRPSGNGSGTPFFLISKCHPALRPLPLVLAARDSPSVAAS